jgi:diguanylate cyclase
VRQSGRTANARVALLDDGDVADGRTGRDVDEATFLPREYGPPTLVPEVGPRLASARSSARDTWICLGLFSIVIVAHVVGWFGVAAYPTVTLGGGLGAIIGLHRRKPTLRWPWWSMCAAAVLWTIGGAVGDATNATGDLTHGRSLLPDLFALPAYACFGLGLYGLLRSRRARTTGSERGELLDGIMLGAGALLMVNVLIIVPTMDRPGTWVMARLSVSVYPAVSMCLLVIAARLAFSPGDRSFAFRLLLIGTLSLFVGDIVFAFGEIGRFKAPTILEVPYLLVGACLSAAVLHPSIRSLARPSPVRASYLSHGRLVAVAGALLAPIVVIATRNTLRGTPATIGLCLVLAVAAILRLSNAIHEQAALESRLSHQANHDELTGLPSRSLILVQIDDMLADSAVTGQPVSVMFIDLDQFKLINDSMGHAIGDQLLVLAAQRILSAVRPEDAVGRMSGDEFIVAALLDVTGASRMAERIRKMLGDGFSLDSAELFISASIGVTVAHYSADSDGPTLIQEADTAMYRSKDRGRNRVTTFDSSMRERVARRVELERDLRQALNERHFTAHFQPIVSLPSGRIHGFEALARWKDGDNMIAPTEFIPIAEESGLIVPLGAFMLDEACRQLAEWRETMAGAERLYVSVNLSPRQMRESDIVDTVAETLARHHLPGDALWLEITESVLMEDSLATAGAMAGLRTLGVRLSVDDFGTGFSSLSYLKLFPVSCVKIDRSFVLGLGRHESDSSLVAAIIAMGSALDLESVAEGVETRDQAQRLFALGCRQAQGYLYAEAMAPEDVPDVVDRLGIVGAARSEANRRCTTQPRRN